MIEQAPDPRVYLGEDEIQHVITALSVGVAAMRGLDPLADAGRCMMSDELDGNPIRPAVMCAGK